MTTCRLALLNFLLRVPNQPPHMRIGGMLYKAQQSGRGQVVDTAICDSVVSLMTMIYGFRRAGLWDGGREENLLDGREAF